MIPTNSSFYCSLIATIFLPVVATMAAAPDNANEEPAASVEIRRIKPERRQAADQAKNPQDSIEVKVVGTLRTGLAAIGGETTGTTITAKGITWELDLGRNAKFRQSAEKLDGKRVMVHGNLERHPGVEIKERWIVRVRNLRAVEDLDKGQRTK